MMAQGNYSRWIRHSLLLFPLWILLLSQIGGETEGRTITVDIQGNGDFTTIQNAIDDTDPGDTIQIGNGTYFENLYVNTSLSLIGYSNETCIIDGGGGEFVVKMNAHHVVLSNLTICNTGNYYRGAGVVGNYCDYTVIEQVNFTNNGKLGVDFTKSDHVTIRNSTFHGNDNAGYFEDGRYLVLVNNSIVYNNGYGVRIYRHENTVIQNNDVSFNDWIGLEVAESNDVLVRSNRCEYNVGGGVYLKNIGTNVSIRYNSLSNNVISGLVMYGKEGGNVSGNVMGATGIRR